MYLQLMCTQVEKKTVLNMVLAHRWWRTFVSVLKRSKNDKYKLNILLLLFTVTTIILITSFQAPLLWETCRNIRLWYTSNQSKGRSNSLNTIRQERSCESRGLSCTAIWQDTKPVVVISTNTSPTEVRAQTRGWYKNNSEMS